MFKKFCFFISVITGTLLQRQDMRLFYKIVGSVLVKSLVNSSWWFWNCFWIQELITICSLSQCIFKTHFKVAHNIITHVYILVKNEHWALSLSATYTREGKTYTNCSLGTWIFFRWNLWQRNQPFCCCPLTSRWRRRGAESFDCLDISGQTCDTKSPDLLRWCSKTCSLDADIKTYRLDKQWVNYAKGWNKIHILWHSEISHWKISF